MTRPNTLLTEGSCGRSHSHRHGHHHHHHHHSRGRSPSSLGRSSPSSEVSGQQAKSRMRWILSLGLLLPALAAIIGVVAWAVSAEVVMGARRDSAFKLSGPASRFHQSERQSEDEIERFDSKIGEKQQILPNRKTMTKESRISESKQEATLGPKSAPKSESSDVTNNRNSNVYFLAGLDALNSEARPNFSSLSSSDVKKSAGARVAEVIDRLVSQRKSEGSSPHIVVVAPIPDSKKKSSSSSSSNDHRTTPVPPTTTTESPTPSSSSKIRSRADPLEAASFTRDSDTLLAAAHFLARHHIADKRNDEGRYALRLEPYNKEGKQNFESANLLGPRASSDTEYPAPAQSPTGPPLHGGNGRANNGPGIGQNFGPSNIGPFNNLDESFQSLASQHHLTYLPSNRMGQAPNQMIGSIHDGQMYRNGPQGPPLYAASAPMSMLRNANNGGQAMPIPPHQHLMMDNGQPQQYVNPNQHHNFQQFSGNYNSPPQQPQDSGSVQSASNYAPVFEPNNQPMQRPAQYINRDSYVAAESAGPPPLIDFSAQQIPDEESGGYQESAPAKGITLHFGGGPMGGGGQITASDGTHGYILHGSYEDKKRPHLDDRG